VTSSAFIGAFALAAVGAVIGLASAARSVGGPPWYVLLTQLLPHPFDAAARGVLVALAGLFGAGILLVAVRVIMRLPAEAALFDQLAPGIVGGIVLTLLQLALLPNLGVYGAAALTGGGFQIGDSTWFGLGHVTTTVMPALPVLGALPDPGPTPPAAWALVALPVAAGFAGGMLVVRETGRRRRRAQLVALLAMVVVTVALAAAAFALATGSLGDGQLVRIGVGMPRTVGLLAAELAVGALLAWILWGTPLAERIVALRKRLATRVEGAEAELAAGGTGSGGTDSGGTGRGGGIGGAAETPARPVSGSTASESLRRAREAAGTALGAAAAAGASVASATRRRGAEDEADETPAKDEPATAEPATERPAKKGSAEGKFTSRTPAKQTAREAASAAARAPARRTTRGPAKGSAAGADDAALDTSVAKTWTSLTAGTTFETDVTTTSREPARTTPTKAPGQRATDAAANAPAKDAAAKDASATAGPSEAAGTGAAAADGTAAESGDGAASTLEPVRRTRAGTSRSARRGAGPGRR
jgi:hypothetical protein